VPSSKQDHAYVLIKNKIVTCELRPGEVVSEPALREQFSLTPAATRVALQRLTQCGLVTPIPRHGYVVTPITINNIKEIFHLRRVLEAEAARLAAGKVDVKLLKQYDRQWRDNLDADVIAGKGCRKKLDKALNGNFLFHMHIAQAGGSGKLAEAVEQLLYEGERLIHMGLPLAYELLEIQSGHSGLLQVLAHENDRERAAELAMQHVQSAENIVLKAIVEYPTWGIGL
jgi:DNA-binding GntR family transcriptional regulator